MMNRHTSKWNRDKSEYSSDTLQQIRLKAILSKEGLIGSDLEDIGIAAFAIKNIEYIIKTYHEIFLPYSEHRNLTIGQIMKDPRKMRYINNAIIGAKKYFFRVAGFFRKNFG